MPFSEKRRKALIKRLMGIDRTYNTSFDPIDNPTASIIVNKLEQADPTQTGRYGNWLLEEWLDDSFQLGEDLETVHETLLYFEEIKNRILESS